MSKKPVKPQNMNFGRQSPEHKNLVKLLTDYSGGRYRTHEKFGWMLDTVLREVGNPFTGPALPPEPARAQVEELALAYRACVEATPPLEDVLGPLYMEISCGNVYLGQFFTPPHVAKLCSLMLLGNDDPSERGELIRACDPACGSGIMMLAFAQCVAERWGREATQWLALTAVDIDSICARMSAVQFIANAAVHGLEFGELFVVHGDSLFPDHLWTPVLHATHRQIEVGKQVPHVHHPARKAAVLQAAGGHPDLFPWFNPEETKRAV